MKNLLTTSLLLLCLAGAGAATMNVDLPQSGTLGGATPAPSTYVGRFYGNGAGLTNLTALPAGYTSVGPSMFANTNVIVWYGLTNSYMSQWLTNDGSLYASFTNIGLYPGGPGAYESNLLNNTAFFYNPSYIGGWPSYTSSIASVFGGPYFRNVGYWQLVNASSGPVASPTIVNHATGWTNAANLVTTWATNYLWYGDGSGLTNISVTTTGLVGKILSSQIESNTWYLATNNPALNTSNNWKGSFSGNGAGLTNIPVGAIQNGAVSNGQGGLTLAGTFTGNGAGLSNLTASSIAGVAVTNGQKLVLLTGTFNGSGAGLSNIPPAAVGYGAVTNNQTAVTLAGTFSGNGQYLLNTAGYRLAGLNDVTNIALAAVMPSNAPVIYVSPSGRDSGSGTIADPWLSVGKAVSNAVSGTTVVLMPGTNWAHQVYFPDGVNCSGFGKFTSIIALTNTSAADATAIRPGNRSHFCDIGIWLASGTNYQWVGASNERLCTNATFDGCAIFGRGTDCMMLASDTGAGSITFENGYLESPWDIAVAYDTTSASPYHQIVIRNSTVYQDFTTGQNQDFLDTGYNSIAGSIGHCRVEFDNCTIIKTNYQAPGFVAFNTGTVEFNHCTAYCWSGTNASFLAGWSFFGPLDNFQPVKATHFENFIFYTNGVPTTYSKSQIISLGAEVLNSFLLKTNVLTVYGGPWPGTYSNCPYFVPFTGYPVSAPSPGGLWTNATNPHFFVLYDPSYVDNFGDAPWSLNMQFASTPVELGIANRLPGPWQHPPIGSNSAIAITNLPTSLVGYWTTLFGP